jgi:hypothetical protein
MLRKMYAALTSLRSARGELPLDHLMVPALFM